MKGCLKNSSRHCVYLKKRQLRHWGSSTKATGWWPRHMGFAAAKSPQRTRAGAMGNVRHHPCGPRRHVHGNISIAWRWRPSAFAPSCGWARPSRPDGRRKESSSSRGTKTVPAHTHMKWAPGGGSGSNFYPNFGHTRDMPMTNRQPSRVRTTCRNVGKDSFKGRCWRCSPGATSAEGVLHGCRRRDAHSPS